MTRQSPSGIRSLPHCPNLNFCLHIVMRLCASLLPTDGPCRMQPRFRSMWERYCRGVQAIVYVVDAADHDGLDSGRQELHELLQKPSLARTPLLVLGNKNDLPGALSTTELIERLDLKVRHPASLTNLDVDIGITTAFSYLGHSCLVLELVVDSNQCAEAYPAQLQSVTCRPANPCQPTANTLSVIIIALDTIS